MTTVVRITKINGTTVVSIALIAVVESKSIHILASNNVKPLIPSFECTNATVLTTFNMKPLSPLCMSKKMSIMQERSLWGWKREKN